MEQNKEIKEQTTENFATQTLNYVTRKLFLVIAGLMLINVIGYVLFFANDDKWREVFTSYDFISQDGEGINNINDGTQGDLNNGAESEEEEGQE
ncbi:MAG: hypothetical protein HFH72_09060 [Lachnospiraceae bacterium]|nr:hypothetical protein [Lachnospiraceae bacterium]